MYVRTLGLSWFLFACGAGDGPATSMMEFTPNPAPVVVGVCASDAQVIDTSGRGASLVSLVARFTDDSGGEATFFLEVEELAALLPGGNVVIPPNGAVAASLSFDLGGQGVTSPAEGSVVMVGTGTGGSTQYVGTLRCEN